LSRRAIFRACAREAFAAAEAQFLHNGDARLCN